MATSTTLRSGAARPWSLPVLLAVAWLVAGCGDDPVVATANPNANRAAQQAQQLPEQSGLRFHVKIDDRLGEEQAQALREPFDLSDFRPDASGKTKRDPFRSLAAAQLAAQLEQSKPTEATQICKDTVAPQSSLRELRLVGIVLRGTRSYALFVDGRSAGHIVTKGDCLAQEKARVDSVRAGFVTLQIYPENTTGAPDALFQERTIALYPDEIPVDGDLP
ncbi:hypothetical protein [Haliangium ochraceum]|uniref:Uncharacterized protein n=1 Tax=Haliangium ochraceum (strain DSM 14365 / JCM 11303 / SMP-2) TaxID=502025 RepID=D0LHN0_HALO1|nr:hypothetical protein [Haliangium ochraceum]ACY12892.1 hypothetical protein Hoch_0251 [Haliangium ochraceum DSM 14365]